MVNGDVTECDFSMLLSQELIAKVMEEYLNAKVLRQPVEVVDLQNTEAGYVFSLRSKPKVKIVKAIKPTVTFSKIDQAGGFIDDPQLYVGGVLPKYATTPSNKRAKNGRFTSKSEVTTHG